MYKIINSDCINVELQDIDLIYLDPPFNGTKDGTNSDSWFGIEGNFENYLTYMEERIQHFHNWLAPTGNFIIHADYKAIHYLKIICDRIFNRENFRNEIVWCYSNPSSVKSHLPRKHDNLLWYSKSNQYTFNQEYTAYQGKLNVGGKSGWKEKQNVSEYLEGGKKLEDWWIDMPALCRNEKERVGWKTQKPLKLMERIIKMFSREEETVCDPFCGSGSLLHAAILNRRNAIGVDISEEAIKIVTERLNSLK